MAVAVVIQSLNPLTPVKEDFARVGHYLNTNVTGQDVVVLSAPFLIYPVYYYYDGPAKIETIPQWDRFSGEELPAFNEETLAETVEDISGSRQRIFLVLGYDQGYQDILETHFKDRFKVIEHHELSSDLSVYVFKLRYDDVYSKR